MKIRLLSSLFIFGQLYFSSLLASPLFDQTNANIWKVDESTGQMSSYRYQPGVSWWVDSFQAGIFDLGSNEQALINNLPASSLQMSSQLAPISLVGLGLSELVIGTNKGMLPLKVSPVPGNYTATIMVEMAVDVNLTNAGSVVLKWDISGATTRNGGAILTPGSELRDGRLYARFYLVKNGSHTIGIKLFNTAGSLISSKSLTYNLSSTDPDGVRRDTDKDGLPDLVELAIGLDPLNTDWQFDSDGNGWSDFDEWLRADSLDPDTGLPKDSDNDGWSDFDEGLRGTKPDDLVQALVTAAAPAPGSLSYQQKLRLFQDVPAAARLYEVEYLVDVSAIEIQPVTTWQSFSSYIPGSAIIFNSDDLLTVEEMAMADVGPTAIPLRRTQQLLASLSGINSFNDLRLPASRSQILDIEGFNVQTVTVGPTGSIEQTRKWHLLHWLNAQTDLTPLTFDAGTGWSTAQDWKVLFIAYLKNNLVQTQSLKMNLKSTIDTSLLLGVLTQEYKLEGGQDRPIFNEKHGVSQQAFDTLKQSLAIRENGRTLDDVFADLLTLVASNVPMGNSYAALQSGTQAMPWKEDSLLYLSKLLSDNSADMNLLGYLSRLTLFTEGLAKLNADSTLNLMLGDSDSDTINNYNEILTDVFSRSLYPWLNDSDGDLVLDATDACPLDPSNLCVPGVPVISAGYTGRYDTTLTLNKASYVIATVQLNQVSDLDISIDFDLRTLAGDSAVAGVNFEAMSGTFFIPAGETSASVIINLLPQSTLGTDVFHLVLSNNINATIMQTQVPVNIQVVAALDSIAPVITLSGSGSVNVSLGATYTDAGATAADNIDGDISSSIVTVNLVDTAVVGTYTVTYNVSDAAGNVATQVLRTVNVKNNGIPVVSAYYSAAADWNDYVKNDNSTQFDATNTPADGAETGGYSALIHGGEMRAVNLGVTTCTDQAATDALGAFNWVCDDSTGSAIIVSTGLKDDKNLSDLLDFTTPAWKTNSVTVTGTGAVTTASTTWWSNPVTLANAGGSLATAGSVYVVTVKNPAAGYLLAAEKTALVVQPGVTLTWTSGNSVISGNSQNYLWFEGAIDGTGARYVAFMSRINFSVLRNLSIDAGVTGVYLGASNNNSLLNIISTNNKNGTSGIGVELSTASGNTLTNITTKNSGRRGVSLNRSNNNRLSNINVSNGTQQGIVFYNSSNNIALNLYVANNPSYGVLISSTSANNLLSNITAFENYIGVYLAASGNASNTLLNITASNNNSYGVFVSTSNSIVSNVTATNTASIGVYIGTSTNSSLSSIASVNNRVYGIFGSSSADNNRFSNIAAANNGLTGVRLENSSNNIFSGLLKTGSNGADCFDNTGSTFSDAACTTVVASNITLVSGVTAANSFIGKVGSNDIANADDTNGIAAFPADVTGFDWFNFDNIFRTWGKDGTAFPAAGNRGLWTTGTGRIWDWSLANGDTGDANNPVIQNVLTAQLDGNVANSIEHTWVGIAADQAACTTLVPGSVWNATDDCRSTSLRNATELVDDGIGNDNGLCETDETCLFTPNIGAYQGHGTLISAGTFTNGDTLTGITLMKYSTNGY